MDVAYSGTGLTDVWNARQHPESRDFDGDSGVSWTQRRGGGLRSERLVFDRCWRTDDFSSSSLSAALDQFFLHDLSYPCPSTWPGYSLETFSCSSLPSALDRVRLQYNVITRLPLQLLPCPLLHVGFCCRFN